MRLNLLMKWHTIQNFSMFISFSAASFDTLFRQRQNRLCTVLTALHSVDIVRSLSSDFYAFRSNPVTRGLCKTCTEKLGAQSLRLRRRHDCFPADCSVLTSFADRRHAVARFPERTRRDKGKTEDRNQRVNGRLRETQTKGSSN